MSATSKPRRLAVETLAVCGAALLLTLLVLRAGAWWNRGVAGGGDAWQMLWSIDHVQRALRGEEPFYFSARVWAPEGASLRAHGLSPANTLPAAFLASRFGLFTAYNTMVLLSFVLAAGASYRLARGAPPRRRVRASRPGEASVAVRPSRPGDGRDRISNPRWLTSSSSRVSRRHLNPHVT